MLTLSTVRTAEDMENYLKETWKFQLKNNLIKGNYPKNVKPSTVYKQLFGCMPFSGSLIRLLKELDKQYMNINSNKFVFNFSYGGGTFETVINNVKDYEQALKIAFGKVIKESGFGLTNVSIIKHLIDTGEIVLKVN